MKKLLGITILIIVLFGTKSNACTIIMLSDSAVVLAGSNEDSTFPLTLLWFIPATDQEYGRVCLGYKMMINAVQGGMNDMGLFVDGNSLGKQGWKSDDHKKITFLPILDRLLATCANVDEVKNYFRTYNVPVLDQARIPVMDRNGASMIVEWHNGEVVFLETEESYQIATNFIESDYTGIEKPCWRYNKANEILRDKTTFSIDLVRKTLDATHQKNTFSSTVYSFICNLKRGEIYIYNYHDFSTSVKFNLREELNKGPKEYFLANLFTERKEIYNQFIAEGPANMIEFGYNRINKTTAIMFFNLLKMQYPKAFDREINTDPLSQFGARLWEQGKTEDAIIFLEKNVSEFPDSARVHFELANVYAGINHKEKALAEYKKTLVCDPDHGNAKQAMENLLNH